MRARRFPENPIITQDMDAALGDSINGPSLIRVPDWLPNPLGRYYLYFAHHQGKNIRLAYADDLAGPWTLHLPGSLQMTDTPYQHHIASPDVSLIIACASVPDGPKYGGICPFYKSPSD